MNRLAPRATPALLSLLAPLLLAGGCLADDPEGLGPAPAARTTVAFDFFHQPLPEIPLPNDIATRFDPASATGLRVNASTIAPTGYEQQVRTLIDGLDGWGVLQPINIPFTGPLDVQSILDAHRDADYDLSDDVVYLINIDRGSEEFGRIHHVDLGNGNYPVIVEQTDGYWRNDPRGWTLSILFEEADEDLNDNGRLDPGEDTDADGLLDVPNYLPGANPARDDLAGRADALMSFYERATNTLIAKPLVPLRERTRYAVVVTRRLLDAEGQPVGSPFPTINHTAQTADLMPLLEVLPEGLTVDDIAFAFSYTTQSVESHMVAVRDGLYGHGVQRHIGEQFPGEVEALAPLRDPDAFPDMTNPYVMWTENWLPAFELVNQQFQGGDTRSVAYRQLVESQRYIDFWVVGRFQSPQLFDRVDAEGNPLPFNLQSWPTDLDRIPAPVRGETVHFMLAVPRREVSDRGDGRPAPTVVMGHGYGSNRFEIATSAGYFARHGIATIAIDGPSHGIDVTPDDVRAASALLDLFGLGPFADVVFVDRAFDQNGDGNRDSAADYWSAYLFHTRDMVRQYALDLMQLVRILRGFDGERRWQFDLDGDGTFELAGDFDGDGLLDVGGDAYLYASGGSLGGMISTVLGGIEPELQATAPIVAGGGLGDLGIRSQQGGVREAFILPTMGPLWIGTLDEAGTLVVEAIWTNINNRPSELTLGHFDDVAVGDTFVVENLASGERGCGYVSPEGTVRAGLATDIGDRVDIHHFRGDALVLGDTECALVDGIEPTATLSRFEQDLSYLGQDIAAGSPLRSYMEGLGLRRAHPDLRRFQGLGQLILDPGDPAVYAQYHSARTLEFPGTGQSTGTHSLWIPTVGDMNVPVGGVLTIARAAGVLEYLEPNPGHGMPDNQVLIDSYTAEGVHNLDRYVGPNGEGIHISPDDWAGSEPYLWDYAPRVSPPLRSGLDRQDPLGGVSGLMWVYGNPQGSHGPRTPGEMIQESRERCAEACGEGDCGCDEVLSFDQGNFLFDVAGAYLGAAGMSFDPRPCHAYFNCPEIPPPPAARRNVDEAEANR